MMIKDYRITMIIKIKPADKKEIMKSGKSRKIKVQTILAA